MFQGLVSEFGCHSFKRAGFRDLVQFISGGLAGGRKFEVSVSERRAGTRAASACLAASHVPHVPTSRLV